MTWLARLSFAQAIRWALLWPAIVAALALGAATFVAVAQWRGNWGVAFGLESNGAIPVWIAVPVIASVVLVGPSALFLALWRVVRH